MSDKDIEQQIKSKGLTAARVTLDDFKENIVNTEIVKHVSVSGQVLRWAVLTTKMVLLLLADPHSQPLQKTMTLKLVSR